MTTAAEPIRPDELEGLFAPFFKAPGEPRAALAVSGGSDSTALMVLFADWLAQAGKLTAGVTVLTVDHGLRPESVTEAHAVAARAAALGFPHAILTWQGAKLQTGLQAAARRARYRLLAEYVADHGIALLLTAHTAEDQAETLLMRLARGSGLDGLSAMAPLTMLRGTDGRLALTIARPLLGIAKARLRATLEQRGISWIEDPSNDRLEFERTRLRAAREHLDGLGLTTDNLVSSARRLQRARAALERQVTDFYDPGRMHVAIDRCGFLRIDGAALRSAPAEIAVRVLSQAVAMAGGSDEPVPLANVERIAEEISACAAAGAWTLARAKITATPESILIEREPGRTALPTLTLQAGSQAHWDGRFLVAVGPRLESAVEVRALAAEGLREVRQAVTIPPGAPIGALRTLPAFWRGNSLLAAPNLDFWAADRHRGEISATFTALGNYNSTVAPDEAPSS